MFPSMIVLSAAKFWTLLLAACLVGILFRTQVNVGCATTTVAGPDEDQATTIEQLEDEVASLKADLAARDRSLAEVAETGLRLIGEVRDRNATIAGNQAQLDKCHRIIDEKVEAIDDWRGLAGRRADHIERLEKMCIERDGTIKRLEGEIAELTKRFEAETEAWPTKADLAHNQGYRVGYDKAMARVQGVIENLPGPDALG